ncbi:MAG: hypothetical protein ACTJLK_04165 [Anaplasma sp.]
MSSEQRNSNHAAAGAPSRQQSGRGSGSNPAKAAGSGAQSWVPSRGEIEQLIKCMEEEFGGQISDKVRNAMKEEIVSAVPELTKALIPLIAKSAAENGDDMKSREELVKVFMQIMNPHMQKIVNAATEQ